MTLLQDKLQSNRDAGEKSLGVFITAGFPELDGMGDLLDAIDSGEVDFIELGMPFSDPLAEGLPIQRSSHVSLQNGTTMQDTFRIAQNFRKKSRTPLVLMGYTNPVLRFGISNFFETAHSSGVDGVILPDLPPEESSEFAAVAAASDVHLIFLIAPTTPDDRIKKIDRLSSGFVYAVSITGLTGGHIDTGTEVDRYLRRAGGLVINNPLLVGFGISNHEENVRYGRHTDGCIVGSALIKKVDSLWADPSLGSGERLGRIQTFVYELKHG